MYVTQKWMRLKDDPRNPIIEIEHREYCGECKKHVRFIFGDAKIEIETDDAGLTRIASAIADHPISILKAAEEKFNAAKREFESLKPAVADQ